MLGFGNRSGIPGGSLTGVLVVLALVLSARVSLCQTPEDTRAYTVTGSSAVAGADIERGRQLAIRNGQAVAISLAAGDFLPVEAQVAHFNALNQTLYDRAEDFVEGYRVLTEGRFDKTYRVLVEVTVAVRKIKDQLLSSGILSAGEVLLPSVLLLVSEQSLEDLAPRYWWHAPAEIRLTTSQQTMGHLLSQRGFAVLDPAAALSEHPDVIIADQPDLTDAQAVDIGRRLQADVVVVGSAVVEVAPNTMGAEIRTFRATISVRAIQVSDGESIAAVSRDAVAVNADHRVGAQTALGSAAGLVAEDLAGRLTAVWGTRQAQAGRVEILVRGTANLGNFVNFRRVLASLPGLEQVQVKALAADAATLEVSWKGDARSLADALMRQTFVGFGLSIGEVSPGSLQVRLIPVSAAGQPQ